KLGVTLKDSAFRAGGLVFVTLFGAAGLVACGQAPTAAVGDCINSEDLPEGEIDELNTISCDESHDLEVFHAFDLPKGDFPGEESVEEAAEDECVPAFEDYVGVDYYDSEIWITTISPSEETWDAVDDREILCLLEGDDETESLKDAQIQCLFIISASVVQTNRCQQDTTSRGVLFCVKTVFESGKWSSTSADQPSNLRLKTVTLKHVKSSNPSAASTASTGLLIILLCAMGAGPLFNYGVSVSSALIIRDLGISEGQIGYIVTIVFAGAAVLSIWLGNLADKISVRAQMLLIFLGTAVAMIVAAFAESYWLLVVAALLAGPAQAISNPTTNRVIMRAVPHHKRTGWIGVKQSGVQASQLFAGLFFPAVALALGWTGAALGGAVVCTVLWLVSLNYVPSPTQLASLRRPAPSSSTSPDDEAGSAKTDRIQTTDKLPVVVYFFAAIAMFS